MLVVVGFALIYNIGKFFNLAHGASYLWGAYTGYLLYKLLNVGFFPTLIISALSAGIFGFFTERVVFRPLLKRKASSLVLLIVSLGILILVQSFIVLLFGSDVKVFFEGPVSTISILGGSITLIQIWIFFLTLGFLIFIFFFFYKINLGKRMRAVSDDPYLAKVIGISVENLIAWTMFWGSALAGLAGFLVGLERSVNPSSGMIAVLWAVVASIIGGVGNIVGAILGAYLLGAVENVAVIFFFPAWKTTAIFALLIGFLFLRPTGILGVKR